MTSRTRLKALLVLTAALVLSAARFSPAQQQHSLSVGVNYTYVRTNLVPDCDCFALNGGGAELQYRFRAHLALLADLTYASDQRTCARYPICDGLFPWQKSLEFGFVVVAARRWRGWLLCTGRAGWGEASFVAVMEWR
jgi:hypothetical protein